MIYDTATPYLAAFVLLRKGDKVAFVLRSHTNWMDGYYGLPSGKVEKNEPFTAAAVREALEEVGVTIKPKHLRHAYTLYRHDSNSDWVDVLFEVAEWSGEVTNAEPEKHSEVAWLDIHNLPDNVIPSLRYALEQLTAGDVYGEYGWGSK